MYKKSFRFLLTAIFFGAVFFQAAQTFGQTCTPAPANLVAWYPGDGNANDIKGGSNGTIQGNVTFASGKVVQTFQLGGTGNNNNFGDRVIVGNPANLQLQSFTIENWVKRSSATVVTNNPAGFDSGIMFGYGSNGYTFEMRPDGRIILGLSGISNVDSGGLKITDTNWHHVAVTKSGDSVILYIDGTAVAPQSFGGQTFQFTTNAAIGARGDNIVTDAFFGAVDELSIYSRPLSAAEIQTIYNAGSSGKCKSKTNARIADFDADGKTDISVVRSVNGALNWYYLQSSGNQFSGVGFGSTGDKIASADFDGDGKTDIAVFRPSNGTWYLLRSSLGFTGIQFGAAGDIPVPADFDGDGKADIAVFRPSNGTWYYLRSSDGGFRAAQFGTSGDVPIKGDFDRDGKADFAVFRPSNGTWYILQSSDNGFKAVQFGTNGDIPIAADFDGDAGADIAVFRPSNGTWYYLRSSDGAFVGAQFGQSGDVPAAGDYDGDGKTDLAVFRNGNWYILRSLSGQFAATQFGLASDTPVPAAYLP